VKCILAHCGRDLREGLEGASGGLSTDEYLSFMECIESACQSVSTVLADQLDIVEVELVLQTFAFLANLAEGILCLIAIRNRSIFKRTLHLYLRTLPVAVEETVRQALLIGAEIDLSLGIGTVQSSRSFDQCYLILQKWSQSSGPGTPVVDADHLRAGQLGDLLEDKDSDAEEMADTENGRTITFVDKDSLSSGKMTSQKVQFEYDRPWTWAFCSVLDAYGAAVEDSYMEVLTNSTVSFSSDDVMGEYVAHRFQIFGEVCRCSKALLSQNKCAVVHGEPLALVLPPSTKSAFRGMLEKTLKAVGRAVDILCEELKIGKK
jgi:hypothetical protein